MSNTLCRIILRMVVCFTLTLLPGIGHADQYAYVPVLLGTQVNVIDVTTKSVVTGTGYPITVGTDPGALVASPDGKKVYVANQSGAGSVSVIDTTTAPPSVVATITHSSFNTLVSLAISPDGTTVYALNQGSGVVSVISTASNSVTGTVTVGTSSSNAEQIAVTPDGSKVYVTLASDPAVAEFNTSGTPVVNTIAFGTFPAPYGIAITPDGTRAYVTLEATNAVAILDTATNFLHPTTISTGAYGNPFAITITPDGTMAYVVAGTSQAVVIDLTTNKPLSAITLGSSGVSDIEVTADGSEVFATSGGCNCLYYFPTNSVTPTVSSISVSEGLAIAMAQPGQHPYAYVTNYGAGTVSKVDVASGSVIGSAISVGTSSSQPFGLAVTPDHTKAYVVNYHDSDVAVINVASNTLVSPTIPLGSGSFNVAVTPNGTTAYVPNFTANTVSAINTVSNSVTSISVSGDPFAVAVSPDSTKAYVADAGDGTIAVIKTSTNALCTTSTCSSTGTYPMSTGSTATPSGIAVLPNGTKAYVALQGTDRVSVINTTTDNICTTSTCASGGTYPIVLASGAGPRSVAVTPTGAKVYIVNQGLGTVSVINAVTDNLCTTLTCSSSGSYPMSVGSGPWGISMSPDGTTAYVVNQSGGTISVINTVTDTVSPTTISGLGSTPSVVAMFTPPKPSFGYVTNYGTNSVTYFSSLTNLTFGSNVTVGASGSNPFGVAVSPDRTKAYVANSGAAQVAVINTATNALCTTSTCSSTATYPISVGTTPFNVAFMPNGSKAYVANFGDNTVSVIDASTDKPCVTSSTCASGATYPVSLTTGNPFALAITPDSSKVYVANAGTGTVAVIKTGTDKLCTTSTCFSGATYPISIGGSGYVPSGIAILPTGKKAYVADQGQDKVSVIDLTSDTLCTTGTCSSSGSYPIGLASSSGPRSVAITPDGTKAYVVNQTAGTVAVINTATDNLCNTSTCSSSATYPIPVGSGPWGISISADGTQAYVTNQSGSTVSIINTATDSVSTASGITGLSSPSGVGTFIPIQ